jgi:NitT/TauT family transport system substrate-binding protein
MTSIIAYRARTYFACLFIILAAGCFSSPHASKVPAVPVIRIGFMPLMGHLTLPVAYELHRGKFKRFRLELVKFTSWADMEQALKENRLEGALFLPTVEMQFKRGEYRCVALGCENGSALVMGAWSGIDSAEDLKGKVTVIAVPHIYSMQHINLYRFLVQNGVQYGREVKVVAMSPADMLTSMMRKEIQGFLSGEPYCEIAASKKVGKIIVYTKDIWPSHPGAVLMMRDAYTAGHTEAVQELVSAIVAAAEFIESRPEETARIAAPYFGVSEKTVEDVLSRPLDRISFMDLVPKEKDFERLRGYAVKMKLFSPAAALPDLIDDTFVKNAYRALRRR